MRIILVTETQITFKDATRQTKEATLTLLSIVLIIILDVLVLTLAENETVN